MKLKEHHFSAPLMGTQLEVVLIHDQPCDQVFARLLKFGQQLEQQFSRFLPDSELSQLNAHGELEASDQMLELFELAQALNKQTEGVFNPLLSPVHLGYTQDFNTYGTEFLAQSDDFNDDLDSIVIDQKTIRLSPNQTLDFGGFLKGWTVQAMSALTLGLQGSIINLGGDIYVAGRDLNSDAFELEIDNPVAPSEPTIVSLKNEALATSGSYKRQWQGKHHIVDGARHDSSQSDLVSASVMGPDGAQADALATAAIVLGAERAASLLDELGLRYVLIGEGGEVTEKL